MGFLRKGLFVATGGLSGAAGIKANSKKERTAKAAEAMARAQGVGPRRIDYAATALTGLAIPEARRSAPAPTTGPSPSEELTRLVGLRDAGVLSEEEFDRLAAPLKAALLAPPPLTPAETRARAKAGKQAKVKAQAEAARREAGAAKEAAKAKEQSPAATRPMWPPSEPLPTPTTSRRVRRDAKAAEAEEHGLEPDAGPA
ncbi:MAG: hypothetical protein ACYCS2_00955 [Acidimicrobiales bacterium]